MNLINMSKILTSILLFILLSSIIVIHFDANIKNNTQNNQIINVTFINETFTAQNNTPTLNIAQEIIPEPTYNTPLVYPKLEDIKGYANNDCEKIAINAQNKYGGALIFLIGKDSDGAYIFGRYAGHWMNKIYVKELNKIQYIDYQTQQVFDNIDDARLQWQNWKGLQDSQAFDTSKESPPFSLIRQ